MTASPARDRIDVLDALRGFALLGILMANIQYWAGWVMMTEAQRVAFVGAEQAASVMMWQHLLVDGKFYTLFSLLFGAGFALQLARLDAAGEDGLRLYRRRVAGLLAIGIVHSLLIWDGDILTLYALMGFVLPLFVRMRDGTLLTLAAALVFVVPPLGRALFEALGWAPHRVLMDWSFGIAEAMGANTAPEATIAWMQREDPQGVLAWLASGPLFSWGLRLESWRIPKVLGIMLLGLWCGRHLVAGDLLANRRRLWAVLGVGLCVGLPVSLLYATAAGANQTHWASELGTVPMALGYASAFLLAWPHARRWLGVFLWPGRMALTLYLMQSVLGMWVFYGIGLGWAGRLTPLQFTLYALALYAAQALFARWWLARRAQGPMEAAWRAWTYARTT